MKNSSVNDNKEQIDVRRVFKLVAMSSDVKQSSISRVNDAEEPLYISVPSGIMAFLTRSSSVLASDDQRLSKTV